MLVAWLIPLLMLTLSVTLSLGAWWEFLDSDSYYYFFYRHYRPGVTTLLTEALVLTSIVVAATAALLRKHWAYYGIKWMLILLLPVLLNIFWHFMSRLWDYGIVQYVGDGRFKEVPLTLVERWTEIYFPILSWLAAIIGDMVGLWFWTRREMSSMFKIRFSAHQPLP